MVEGLDRWTLQSLVEERVIAGARADTDEHASRLGSIFHHRESVNRSEGEYVRGDADTPGIELFTGCRRNEILMLRWREIDVEARELDLADTRTGRCTVAPSPSPARRSQPVCDSREGQGHTHA